jgi:uncharacterized protein (PEP-CTERM system associated)
MARRPAGEPLAPLTSHGDGGDAPQTRLVALAGAVLALLAGPASAAQWEVIPALSLRETYTDNVSLAPESAMQSEWVTQVVPGISIRGQGARFRLDATYDPEFLYYAEKTSENSVHNRGSATGNVELAEDILFVDAGAKVDQYNVSLQGPLTISNVNTTGNRTTVTTGYVSPYLQYDFGTAARAEARLTYSTWKSNPTQASLPDNDAGRVDLRLKSGPDYKQLTWQGAYSGESIRYDTQQQEITSQVLTFDARLLITPTVGLLALAGYESYDTGIPPALEDPRYSVGFDWTPTPRTRLSATAGQRLGENVYSFLFHHRTRLTTWSATYAEDVTTSRSEFFLPATASTAGALDPLFQSKYPEPAERQKAVQEYIARTGLPPSLGAPVNFFTEQLFLQKRLLASLALEGARNSLLASAFWQFRKPLPLTGAAALPPSGDFTASETIRTMGGSLAWSLRLTPRDTWNLETGYTRNEFLDTDNIDDVTYVRAGLTRWFRQRIAGSLFYRQQRGKPIQGTGTEYTENAVTASLQMTF